MQTKMFDEKCIGYVNLCWFMAYHLVSHCFIVRWFSQGRASMEHLLYHQYIFFRNPYLLAIYTLALPINNKCVLCILVTWPTCHRKKFFSALIWCIDIQNIHFRRRAEASFTWPTKRHKRHVKVHVRFAKYLWKSDHTIINFTIHEIK